MAQGPSSAAGPNVYLDGVATGGWTHDFINDFGFNSSDPGICFYSAKPIATYRGKTYYFNSWYFYGTVPDGMTPQSAYSVSSPYTEKHGTIYANAYFTSSEPPSPTLKYQVTVSTTHPTKTNVSGGGYFSPGETCLIATSIKIEYKKLLKFLYWESSDGEKIYDLLHSFTVDHNIAWLATYEERQYTGLILYDPVTNPEKILYSQTNNMILRDE